MSFNLQIVVGNVGADPEVRYMPNGGAVTTFSVATTKKWNKDGQKQEKTTWHKVTYFNRLAEVAAEYVKKGTLLVATGETEHQKYQDKTTGADRYSTQIIGNTLQLLGGRPDAGQQQAPQQSAAPAQQGNAGGTPAVGGDFVDDIPFAPFMHGTFA